jgi:hypothetical protein
MPRSQILRDLQQTAGADEPIAAQYPLRNQSYPCRPRRPLNSSRRSPNISSRRNFCLRVKRSPVIALAVDVGDQLTGDLALEQAEWSPLVCQC